MPIMSKPSAAPRTALTYITIGALMTVWSGVWYFSRPPHSTFGTTIVSGLFLSGLVLLAIGFAVGQIGRAARDAELPPREATAAVAKDERLAATNGLTAGPLPGPPAAQPPPQGTETSAPLGTVMQVGQPYSQG